MTQPNQEWAIEFFASDDGKKSPVTAFLRTLPKAEIAKIRNHLRLLQERGVDITFPQARPLKGHKPLWELRPIPNRLIYVAIEGRKFVILHAFTKKKQKTDQREIDIAKRRYEILLAREKKR